METPIPCLICKEPSSYPLVENEVDFVLQKVLQVPETVFSEETLEGRLALCGDCRQRVWECRGVHEELCRLQRKWNEVRAAVIRKVNVTAAGEEEDDAPDGQDAIRRFVLNHGHMSTEFLGWGQVAEEESVDEEAADERNEDSATPEIRELPVVSTPQTTECLFCPVKLKSNSLLIAHMRVHTRERPFWCAFCDWEFTHKSHVKSHQRIHLGGNPPRRLSLECLFCRKKFRTSSHLERHMRAHTGERPFFCGDCGREFPEQSNFTLHQRTHTGERPHQCKLCRKRFVQKGSLSRHVRRHLGEKPWKCPECGKAFVEKSYLTGHRVVHTGEKPFQCDLCPRKFAHSSNLFSHKKKVH